MRPNMKEFLTFIAIVIAVAFIGTLLFQRHDIARARSYACGYLEGMREVAKKYGEDIKVAPERSYCIDDRTNAADYGFTIVGEKI